MKKILYIISVLILLGGVGFLSYPSFANYINQRFSYKEISEYDDTMDKMSQKKIDQMLGLANQYNQDLPGAFPADPFSGTNINNFKDTPFEDFFMTKEGEMLGYVEVPSINVYLPVYYGTREKELQKGAGLVHNTSLPVGGKGTHSVISAHTGLASKKMFTDLVNVEKGDVFFVHVLNMHLAYKVDQIKVVLPDETKDLLIQQDKDYSTLLTCTPFGVNDHRLLVRGKRIPYDFSKKENTTAITAQKEMYLWIAVISVLIIVILVYYIRKRKQKKKQVECQEG